MHSLPPWQRLKQHPDSWQPYLLRQQVVQAIRHFFLSNGFTEVDTPLLVRYPGTEPYLEVFETQLLRPHFPAERAFLTTSPEYAMKKLVVAGLTQVFQICKSFRNGEGDSPNHNSEFTMLEWYRAGADYTDIMDDVEQLFLSLANAIFATKPDWNGSNFTYQKREYQLRTPWPRVSVAEAFERYVGVTTDQLLDRESLAAVARAKELSVSDSDTWEQLFNQLFLNIIDPQLSALDTPIFIYDFPASQAALARRKPSDPRFAERFEVYLAGLELGNAFTELADAHEQQQRFEADLAERTRLGKIATQYDADYLAALAAGLPTTGGIAMGVDRLAMLLADVTDIRDVLYFPIDSMFATAET